MQHPLFLRSALAVLLGTSVVGCTSPLDRSEDQDLRERLVNSNRAYLRAIAAGPVIEISREPSDVESELSDERRTQLDRMSGPSAYIQDPLKLGADLVGESDGGVLSTSLRHAIHLAAKHNLNVQLAQVQPAINQSRVSQAEAVFDAVFFTNFNYSNTDEPRPQSAINPAFGAQQTQNWDVTSGIRKNLSSGGQVTADVTLGRIDDDPSLFSSPLSGNSGFGYYDTDVQLQLNQPLLRNFGADINRSSTLLEINAEREALSDLRATLLGVVLATEEAYWELSFARAQLLIQQRLLVRTIKDRDQLKKRQNFDVSPVRLTEANSFVELRRADVIRARQQVRTASDRLKQLINAPDMPLADETLILPVDDPAVLPLQFHLLDVVTTALRHRPDLQRALLEIDDASIRQRVADNQRLPILNLGGIVRFNGVGDELAAGLRETLDYILTAQFEVPIGNRGPEAEYREQTLARRAAVIGYQQTAQQVVLDVKEALRDLHTEYELIGATRAARRAAADNLRALEEQEEAGVALTPEFLLDLKLSTQQRLANAEIQEIRALTDYNNSIARLYQTMGTLLQRNGIVFRQ